VFLDSVSITQQPDVGKVGRDGIELLEDFAGSWHPRFIDQGVPSTQTPNSVA